MTTDRAPDDCGTSEAAAALGLPLHRIQQVVREGFVAQPTKGRIGLIAAALGHVASLRSDASRLPSTSARRAAERRDDSACKTILDMEGDALHRLDRIARLAHGATSERAAAIRMARDRIRAAKAEALRMLRDA